MLVQLVCRCTNRSFVDVMKRYLMTNAGWKGYETMDR